jgi:hypothetical protein
MGCGQVLIDGERSLARGDTLPGAARDAQHWPQSEMRSSMLGSESDRLEQSRLGGREARGSVFREEIFREMEIHHRRRDKRVDVLRLERQGALEKRPRLRQTHTLSRLRRTQNNRR